MDDRELLEWAAKAAGMDGMRYCQPLGLLKLIDPSNPDGSGSVGPNWNPLTDDGDALRLAVKLRLDVEFEYWENGEGALVTVVGRSVKERHHIEIFADTPDAATRRAIVRAAAAIGQSQQGSKP
jgi:hypothetical protein